MRVRITQALSGTVDGIRLCDFISGEVYEVSTSLGSYLLCERWAEPIPDEGPARVVQVGETRSIWTSRDHVAVKAQAAERARRAPAIASPPIESTPHR